MTKQKLIKQYQKKIADCDIRIKSSQRQIRAIRNSVDDSSYMDSSIYLDESKDMAIASAQRQCYIQFISDIEDELE